MGSSVAEADQRRSNPEHGRAGIAIATLPDCRPVEGCLSHVGWTMPGVTETPLPAQGDLPTTARYGGVQLVRAAHQGSWGIVFFSNKARAYWTGGDPKERSWSW